MSKLFTLTSSFVLATSLLFGQAGTLDPSFNNDGIATLAPGTLHDVANAVAIQSDQKIVFTGTARITSTTGFTSDLVIGRLKNNSSLDTTFASNGIYHLASTGGSVFGYDVKIQPDGKIVVCGGYSISAANTDFLVIRLNSDGTPDTSFGGGDGIAIFPVAAAEDYAYELEILSNGKILLAGSSSIPGFSYDRAILMCVLPNGTLDSGFGNGGFSSVQISSTSSDIFRSLEVLQSGKIIAAGVSNLGNNESMLMAAFLADGSADNAFGTSGILTTTDFNQVFDMVKNGNLVYLTGRIITPAGFDLGLACIDTTGNFVSGFGQNGIVVADYNPIDVGLAITLQSDGKIICAGTSGMGALGNRDMLVMRFLPDGNLDAGFNASGYNIIPTSTGFEELNAVALQADGKIVVVGFGVFSNNDMVFIRLKNDVLTASDGSMPMAKASSLYPVPLTGTSLWIRAGEMFTAPIVCELYDSLGRLYAMASASHSHERIELKIPDALPKGVYILRIRGNGKEEAHTIIK